MNRENIKIALIFLFVFLTNISFGFTQSVITEQNQTIITSNPNGAYVQLIGEYTIRGLTPLKIPYKLEGLYSIKISKYGYENWSTVRDLTNVNDELSLNLTSKSRFKAGLRSFFFPGWGHYYSDRKIQGILLGGIGLASTINTIDKVTKYNQIVDDYNYLIERDKIQNLSYEERNDIRDKISAKQNEADDAYNKRQKWLYISASIWIYNVLDAVLFFKYDTMRSTHELFPTVFAMTNGSQMSINLKWDF